MREAVGSVLDLRASAPTGLSRLISWSFAIHLTAAACVLAWQAWLSRPVDDHVMMISLSGSVGPSTTGTTPIGGKQVDQVAPEPKRPEPTPVQSAPRPEMTIPVRSTTKTPPVKSSTAAQTSSVVRSATGSQVAAGSSVIDTGARGESTGLAQGGGTGATVDKEFEFCCTAYLNAMTDAIKKHVNFAIGEHGEVVIKFAVGRDGSISRSSIQIVKSSGATALDRETEFGVRNTTLQPLPSEYKPNVLNVVLNVRF